MDPRGLVSVAQLREVAEAAVQDFEFCVKSYPDFQKNWAEALEALETDLEIANQVLVEAGLATVGTNLSDKVRRVLAEAENYTSPSAARSRKGESPIRESLCGGDSDETQSYSEEDSLGTDDAPTKHLLP